MKKSILYLGKGLNKSEQKEIFGGRIPLTTEGDPCYDVMEGQGLPAWCPCSNDNQCASGSCVTGAGYVIDHCA